MSVRTATPFKDRDVANPPRCPVHRTRMQYRSERNGAICLQKDDRGNPCSFAAYPKAMDPELLKGTVYEHGVRLYVQHQKTEDDEEGVAVYLQLVEAGLLVNVTPYVNVDDEEGITFTASKDKKKDVVKLNLVFDKLDMVTG